MSFLKKFKEWENYIKEYVELSTRLKESGKLIKIKFEEMKSLSTEPLSVSELKQVNEGIALLKEILGDSVVEKNLFNLIKLARENKIGENK